MPEKNQPEYEILFKWKYLEFDLPEDKQKVYMEK
jgi:hypothetical protein